MDTHHGEMDTLLRGAMNGAVATVPQSLTILAGKALGLLHVPPPEQITETAMEQAGIEPQPGNAGTDATILALHFAYGAAGAAAFSAIRPWLPENDVAAGIGFGLAVWAGSYLGIMPALHLYPPPERDTRGRVATMIAAHVAYGAALGLLERAERDRTHRAPASPRGPRPAGTLPPLHA